MTHGSSDVVSPDLLLDAVLAYQKTGAISAALSLDLFSAIPETEYFFGALCATHGSIAATWAWSASMPLPHLEGDREQ